MPQIVLHLVRHGRVASHRGDTPLVEEGHDEIRAAGMGLVECVRPHEEIHILCTPTARSSETAAMLHAVLSEHTNNDADIKPPREEWAIRNPDLFLAGFRVEMVSTPEAMAQQIPEAGLSPAAVDAAAFFHPFFRSSDRVGYWLHHADPPGEDAVAVARRIVAFCVSLQYFSPPGRKRFVCVTHSPVMRAVLKHYLHHDPGEPEWVERIDVEVAESGNTISFRDLTTTLPPGPSV